MYVYKMHLFPSYCQRQSEILALWSESLRSIRTYRVVSWLMLAKDELVRELTLLLLRSLKRNERCIISLYYSAQRDRGQRKKKDLHQLQIFEGRQFLWHNTELVSIQISEEADILQTFSSVIKSVDIKKILLFPDTNTHTLSTLQYNIISNSILTQNKTSSLQSTV